MMDGAVEFVENALAQLVRGVRDRHSPFHVIGLATTGLDGAPALRSVVLRGCQPGAGRLVFHTDRRSAKYAELVARPEACALAYSAPAKLQLRLSGRVILDCGNAATQEKWRAMSAAARACYRCAPAPGAALPAGLHSAALVLDDAAAEAHLVICTLQIARLDVLHLAASGHRRAVAVMAADGLEARWVAA